MIINIGILEGRDITDIDLDLDLETIKITEGVKKTLKQIMIEATIVTNIENNAILVLEAVVMMVDGGIDLLFNGQFIGIG